MTNISKLEIRNESLFELTSRQHMSTPAENARPPAKEVIQQQIDTNLASYLLVAEYPWKALGNNLTAFVTKCIERIALTDRIKGNVSPLAYLKNTDLIVVCEGAEVEPFAFIEGPAWIGPNVKVRHGAYVRGSVFADQGSVIGHTSEAKGSVFLPQAKAAHFAYVGDSILGVDCNLGAGTKLANLRLDHGEVKLLVEGQRQETGLKKFGAILGNRAQTGCNTVTNPGTILLPNALTLPNATVTGIVGSRRR